MTLHSTSKKPSGKSKAAWLASLPKATQVEFLNSLSPQSRMALPWIFKFWAHPHQLTPEGNWRTWLMMGGRGAGKTRAGSEWIRSLVEGPMPLDRGKCRNVALVGETYDQVRSVMIEGPSGILACTPPDRMPAWIAGKRQLVWPNGAVATAYSAHEPENLRGPQFDAAWADELAKWKKSEDVWDMLQFALRLGDDPRAMVTTTPRNVPVLKRLVASPSTVMTHAKTEANAAYLAESFLTEVRERYANSWLARQELDGVIVEDLEGALWTAKGLVDVTRDDAELPVFSRIVVAVDPPVSAKSTSDECGIVVVGAVTKGPVQSWRAVVLEDASVQGASPTGWAQAAIDAMERHGADRIVVEVNQGGNMVREVIATVDPLAPIAEVRASDSKEARAEPVAALYENGRVAHVRGLDRLEEQMGQMTTGGFKGKGSPDRVDALVWALTALMIEPAKAARKSASVRVGGL
ncbi:MAG: terminase family protein [Deltaproteobacteria bacterium]